MTALKLCNLFPEDLPRIIQRPLLVYRNEEWREVMSNQASRTASDIYNFVTHLSIVRRHNLSIETY